MSESQVSDCRMMAAPEVMTMLGISRSALLKLTFQKINPIPSVKVGPKLRRFPLEKVRVWMDKLEK